VKRIGYQPLSEKSFKTFLEELRQTTQRKQQKALDVVYTFKMPIRHYYTTHLPKIAMLSIFTLLSTITGVQYSFTAQKSCKQSPETKN
jgi:hypothetical protein